MMQMHKCSVCGGKLKRVHRTFFERFPYMAIYECRNCENEELVPRRFMYHLGRECRCPQCGTLKLKRLKAPDHIDRMHTGFLNFLERLSGGQLYHCRFCRLQFYDRRPLASELASEQPEANETVDAGSAAAPKTGAAKPPEATPNGAHDPLLDTQEIPQQQALLHQASGQKPGTN